MPIWAWLVVAFVVVGGLSSLGQESQTEDSSVEEPIDQATSTTVWLQYQPSDDPIENLLWMANSETPDLEGWKLIESTFTDDDILFDDIRIDVVDTVDYKSFEDTRKLVEVTLAIMERVKSPVQFDIRTEVESLEVKPDGSIESGVTRREWIEVFGDDNGITIHVDVYGHRPAEDDRMEELQRVLESEFPEALVTLSDTSAFD